MEELTEIILPNGSTVAVRVTQPDRTEDWAGGAETVSFVDKLNFADVANSIAGIAEAMGSVFERAKPDKATVSLGFEIAVKSGRLIAILVEGEGKGTLNVSLEWAGRAKTPAN
jgi:hypothetical protein